jgi:uncharacterized protein YxjI
MAIHTKSLAPPRLGFFPNFISQKEETVVLKERLCSISGDSFIVKTAAGRPILRVKGTVRSWSRRTKVADINGKALFDIRKKIWSLRTQFYFENPQSEHFFKVKNKFRCKSSVSFALID